MLLDLPLGVKPAENIKLVEKLPTLIEFSVNFFNFQKKNLKEEKM